METIAVICMPDDQYRIEQLNKKLAEYKDIVVCDSYSEERMLHICKAFILSLLLKSGAVKIHYARLKMAEEYGSNFCADTFRKACAIIEDYCTTGGKNSLGGTGLPT